MPTPAHRRLPTFRSATRPRFLCAKSRGAARRACGGLPRSRGEAAAARASRMSARAPRPRAPCVVRPRRCARAPRRAPRPRARGTLDALAGAAESVPPMPSRARRERRPDRRDVRRSLPRDARPAVAGRPPTPSAARARAPRSGCARPAAARARAGRAARRAGSPRRAPAGRDARARPPAARAVVAPPPCRRCPTRAARPPRRAPPFALGGDECPRADMRRRARARDPQEGRSKRARGRVQSAPDLEVSGARWQLSFGAADERSGDGGDGVRRPSKGVLARLLGQAATCAYISRERSRAGSGGGGARYDHGRGGRERRAWRARRRRGAAGVVGRDDVPATGPGESVVPPARVRGRAGGGDARLDAAQSA